VVFGEQLREEPWQRRVDAEVGSAVTVQQPDLDRPNQQRVQLVPLYVGYNGDGVGVGDVGETHQTQGFDVDGFAE
jgi:hypothetical protein